MKSHGFVGVLHNPEDGVMKLTITLVIDKSLAPSLASVHYWDTDIR